MSETPQTPVQPKLADLMARYLERQTEARASGLGPVEIGEVMPFEAAPVQAVEPQVAWTEALAALPGQSAKAPPDWSSLVSQQEPTVALAFAVGNFPQLVRHLQPLLHTGKLSELKPTAGRPVNLPSLVSWAEKAKKDQVLLAVGVLRLARQFELARKLLADVPADQRANEEAALAWHEGKSEEAIRIWESMTGSVPALFNRGMAALFTDQTAEARKLLKEAIAKLPETSAWHHLGRLYLTLAEMRK